jgi:hypothetical protein
MKLASVRRIERRGIDHCRHVRGCNHSRFRFSMRNSWQILWKCYVLDWCKESKEPPREVDQRHGRRVHGLPPGWKQVFVFFKSYSFEVPHLGFTIFLLAHILLVRRTFFIMMPQLPIVLAFHLYLFRISRMLCGWPQVRQQYLVFRVHFSGSLACPPTTWCSHCTRQSKPHARWSYHGALTLHSVGRKLGAPPPAKVPLPVYCRIGLPGFC